MNDKQHERRVMIKMEGSWAVWKFEFDGDDSRGVAWHRGRSFGTKETIEDCTGHFESKGYTVIEWRDEV